MTTALKQMGPVIPVDYMIPQTLADIFMDGRLPDGRKTFLLRHVELDQEDEFVISSIASVDIYSPMYCMNSALVGGVLGLLAIGKTEHNDVIALDVRRCVDNPSVVVYIPASGDKEEESIHFVAESLQGFLCRLY